MLQTAPVAAATARKQEALEYFVEYLLRHQAPVAKVVLFGSVAKGTATKESDVDLIVIGTCELTKLSELCAEAQLETYARYGESVEPLVYSVEELRAAGYFLYRAIRYGKEVYSMREAELKRSEAENYLSLSEEYLEGARLALKAASLRLAVDAVYNAAELSVKGLLLFELAELPGSDGGLVGEFGRLYVKSRRVPADLGRRLHRGLGMRNRARYDFNAEIGRDHAKELMALAKELQKILTTELKRRGRS